MAEPDYLNKLIKWAAREEWRDMFDDVFDMHFAAVLDDFRLEFDELDDLIGEAWADSLWNCAFEDFLTRPRDEDGLTVVDDYLKRRGWKDGATSRRYLEALRDSAPGLYTVGEVVPGVSLVLHDRIGDGEPVTVAMKSRVGFLRGGDMIAARVIEVSGRAVISDGILPFSRQAGDELAEMIHDELAELQREVDAVAAKTSGIRPEDDAAALAGQIYLLQSGPLYSDAWLEVVLAAATGRERQEYTNSDGDAVELQTLRFAFRPGVAPESVRGALDGVPDLIALDEMWWNWMGAEGGQALPAAMAAQDGQALPEGDIAPLATLELAEDALLVTVDSPERAETVKALLAAAAPGLLSPPTTVVHSAGEILGEGN